MWLKSSSAFFLVSAAFPTPFDFGGGFARLGFFAGGGEGEREASGLLVLRLRFLAGAELRGGDRDSERESSLRAAFRGGLRDLEDSLSYFLPPFCGGERSRTGALPLRRGGEGERVIERPRFGGGERESEYERRFPF